MIEILAISTDGIDCGIAEYLGYLRRHLPSDFIVQCDPAYLDPLVFFSDLPVLKQYQGPQVVWMNYHAALHSRWTSGMIARLRVEYQLPVVVTYHDTGVPNSLQCTSIYNATLGNHPAPKGAFIVHEPCPDLPEAIYLRQGIPDWQPPWQFHDLTFPFSRPVLGTVGFPFPWKNYDLLADATAEAGWSLLLLAPRATPIQIEEWRKRNPWIAVYSNFLPAEQVVSYLSACDATAFLYSCANTGTSGAIRQGIAARKPVFASEGCRQFRDLDEDREVGHWAIHWVNNLTPTGIANALGHLPLGRLDPRIVRLAERDSWANQARQYAIHLRRAAGVATV